MGLSLRSFAIPCPPESLWAVLTDFGRWKDFFILPEAEKKGWGRIWKVREGAGAGMVLEMLHGEELRQVWAVDHWQPPERLALSSRSWHWKYKPYLAMRSSLDIGITAISPRETGVDVQLATEFSFPVLGAILNQTISLKKDINAVLAGMETGLTAALRG